MRRLIDNLDCPCYADFNADENNACDCCFSDHIECCGDRIREDRIAEAKKLRKHGYKIAIG